MPAGLQYFPQDTVLGAQLSAVKLLSARKSGAVQSSASEATGRSSLSRVPGSSASARPSLDGTDPEPAPGRPVTIRRAGGTHARRRGQDALGAPQGTGGPADRRASRP